MNPGRGRQTCREATHSAKRLFKRVGGCTQRFQASNESMISYIQKKDLKQILNYFLCFSVFSNNFILKTKEFCGQSLEILLYQG